MSAVIATMMEGGKPSESPWVAERKQALVAALHPSTDDGVLREADASEFLARAHEDAKKPLVAIDIRTGNVGRQGVAWVETTTALAALRAALSATPNTRDGDAK
jgi:hypothetical protein